MPPFVSIPAEVEAEAPDDRLALFLDEVANAGMIAVLVEAMEDDPDELCKIAGEAEAAGRADPFFRPSAPSVPPLAKTHTPKTKC